MGYDALESYLSDTITVFRQQVIIKLFTQRGVCLDALKDKLKEVLASVLPISGIVLILHFTISPLNPAMLYAFLLGSVLVIIGLTVFLFGIDQGLDPIGHGIGNSLAHSKSYAVIITICLVLGFFISY